MKIKRVVIRGARGYLNFDVSFPQEENTRSISNLSFLIGRNGSGKTTFLSLLTAVMTPSYILLNQIRFDDIIVYCYDDFDVLNKISVRRTREKILFRITFNKDFFDEEFEVNPIEENDESFINEKFNAACDFFGNSRTAKFIKNMGLFVSLDLSRKTQTDLFSVYRKKKEMSIYSRMLDKDNSMNDVDLALQRIQKRIDMEKNQMSVTQSLLSKNFYDKVIEESLTMSGIFDATLNDFEGQLKLLKNRRMKTTNVFYKLNLNKSLIDSFEKFFNQNEKLLMNLLSEKNNGLELDSNKFSNWIINSTQFEKIDRIIQYGQEYQDGITESRKSFTRLTDAMNSFLVESNKNIDLYGLNGIIINLPKNQQNSLMNLSSGEKQIFIILSNIVFSAQKNPQSVFVIDEPELSLHISWQELFVDALQRVSPETQFILATHSPSIIARRERQSLCVDLAKDA